MKLRFLSLNQEMHRHSAASVPCLPGLVRFFLFFLQPLLDDADVSGFDLRAFSSEAPPAQNNERGMRP